MSSAMLIICALHAFNFTTPHLTNPPASNVLQQNVLFAHPKTIVVNAIRDSRSQTLAPAWPATLLSAHSVSSTTSATSATLDLPSQLLWLNAWAATSTTASAVRRPTTAVLLAKPASLLIQLAPPVAIHAAWPTVPLAILPMSAPAALLDSLSTQPNAALAAE